MQLNRKLERGEMKEFTSKDWNKLFSFIMGVAGMLLLLKLITLIFGFS